MQGTYTITEAQGTDEQYTNSHGTLLKVWLVGLKDARSEATNGLFELHQKPETAAPSGDIDVEKAVKREHNGETKVRLFKKNKPPVPGQKASSGPQGAADGKFDRRPEHPRNEARMIHTSALSATPGYIDQLLTLSLIPQPTDEAAYWKLVGHVATKLTRSYERAMEVEEPQQTLPEVPPDTNGLEPDPVADASIAF